MAYCRTASSEKMNRRAVLAVLITLIAVVLTFVILTGKSGEESPSVGSDSVPETVSESAAVETTSATTPAATSESTSESMPTTGPTLTPEPTSDLPEGVDIDSWELRLVNTNNLLEADYAPERTAVEGDHSFDSRASGALKDFITAARDQGLSAYLTSSYRPYETQKYLFDRKVGQQQDQGLDYDAAVDAAKRIVAYPGTSEHQLGLAADITDRQYEAMGASLAETDLLIWMGQHCQEYGFILRYPFDKQDITGVMFEPWHFRYVGIPAATYIMEKGLCLEEFHGLYR